MRGLQGYVFYGYSCNFIILLIGLCDIFGILANCTRLYRLVQAGTDSIIFALHPTSPVDRVHDASSSYTSFKCSIDFLRGAMISELKFFHKCENCRKTYRYKHACSGKAHRRRRVLAPSANSSLGRASTRAPRPSNKLWFPLNGVIGPAGEHPRGFLYEELGLAQFQSCLEEVPVDLKRLYVPSSHPSAKIVYNL